jgi:VanZ family protein
MKLNYSKPFLYLWMIGVGVVTVLSLTPVKHVPDLGFLVYDKFLHLSCYFVIAILACLAGSKWNMRYLLCFMTLLISVGIEFLQPITGRSFDELDMVANLLGIIIAICVTKLFLWRFPAFSSQ